MRSLGNNLKIHCVLQTLLDKNISVACITESWLQENGHEHTVTIIKSFGFEVSLSCRKDRTGGGIATLVRNPIKFTKVTTPLLFDSLEWNAIRIIGPICNYLLLCVYRKQEFPMASFLEDLSILLEKKCSASCDEVIVLGDFNVHYGTQDKRSSDLVDLLAEYGLLQAVTEPTRISGFTLDLLFHNPISSPLTAAVYPELAKSTNESIKFDHFPIISDLPWSAETHNCESQTPVVKQYRRLKQINPEAFQTTLGCTLSTLPTHENMSFPELSLVSFPEYLKNFNQCLQSTLDQHAPLQTNIFSHHKPQHTDPEWMDEEYKNERRIRRKLERDSKRLKTHEAKMLYVRQRDHCITLANQKMCSFYRNLIASTDNHNTLFKTVSRLWGKNLPKQLPDCGGNFSLLANKFNTFFSDKVSKIRQSFPSVSLVRSSNEENDNAAILRDFVPISLQDLRKIVTDMIIKTSPDDVLPSHLVKSNIETLLPYMHTLVNISLASGDISGLKDSVISPILKKLSLDKNVLKFFRPIVNLQFLSKVIEKVVLKQLNEHMAINNLECDQQFGYKKNFSTETMLIQIVDEVLVGFEQKSGTILVLLDMSSAFDTVDINKLLHILEHKIGLKGTVLQWFHSFLIGRKQKVIVNGHMSELLLTLYGVPQGSVLGPVLFNIYVSSLPSIIHNQGFASSMYADDTNARIKFSFKFQLSNVSVKVPQLINEVSAWMKSHFLKINPDKTEIMLFCPPSCKKVPKISGIFVDDCCIRFKDNSVKLLGVHLDTHLTLDNHINQLVSECYYHLKNVGKIRRYLSLEDAEKLIHALITSKFDYSNALLYGIKASSLKKLQKVQNYAARLVHQLPAQQPIDADVLHDLHWLSIERRIVFKLLLLVHKFFMGIAPSCFNEMLLVKDDFERLLSTPFMNTVPGRQSFSYASPRFWNRLPKDIRLLCDTDKFKQSIKTVLFTNRNNILQAVNMYTH